MTERRRDPLTGEWSTFATHRQERTFLPAADACPLCPSRDPGAPTEVPAESYDLVVFDNLFPSLSSTPPAPETKGEGFYEVEPAVGATEVVLYTPDHTATLADVGVDRLTRLIEVWTDRYEVLGARDEVDYVFVFENKGEAIGVTLHHPHGQIYGYPEVPPRPRLELETARRHHAGTGRCLHCDVVAHEVTVGTRVVVTGSAFVAHVPFANRFPYEVHIVALDHVGSLAELDDARRRDLAEVLDALLKGYDRLHGFSLPYVLSVHQTPTDGGDWAAISHLHVEITPMHRSPTKLKYLAGSEVGAGAFIADMSSEQGAEALRRAMCPGARG